MCTPVFFISSSTSGFIETDQKEASLLLGFQPRFEPRIRAKIKRHTIRAKRKRRPRPGETCHCYTGLRQKGARLIGRWLCVRVQDIKIRPRAGQLDVWIDNHCLERDEREALAVSDGFEDFAEMMDFWQGRLPFHGDMIHWDPDCEMAPPKKRGSRVKNGRRRNGQGDNAARRRGRRRGARV